MMSRSIAFLAFLAFAGPVMAQTSSTGSTGSTGTTGTTTSSTTSSTNSNRVSSSNTGSGNLGSSGSSGSGPFQGTVPANFSGSSGSTSTATNTGGGLGKGISGTVGVPSTTNPWLSTYGNPYAIGQSVLGSSSTSKAAGTNKGFGQPIYSITNTTVTTTGLQNNPNISGFNNSNVSKTPRYTSALSEDIPFVSHPPAQLQVRLQDMLARSSSLRDPGRIQVVVDGGTVVLVGRVGSERERRIAESMLRLTPGVSEIDNRLTLPGEP